MQCRAGTRREPRAAGTQIQREQEEPAGSGSPGGLPQRWQLPSLFMPPHEPDRRRPPIASRTTANTGTEKTRMGSRTEDTEYDRVQGSEEGSESRARFESLPRPDASRSLDPAAAPARSGVTRPHATQRGYSRLWTSSVNPRNVLQFRSDRSASVMRMP